MKKYDPSSVPTHSDPAHIGFYRYTYEPAPTDILLDLGEVEV